jgi:integrase
MGKRRDNGAGSIYFDHRAGTDCRGPRYHKTCTGRWSASISMGTDGSGKRVRGRLTAPTRTELLTKLDDAKRAAASCLEVTSSYTVAQCLDDFLDSLEGLAPKTVAIQTANAKLLRPVLGAYRLREMSAKQVLAGLRKVAEGRTTRTVALAHNTLARAITLAMAEDTVGRNVALVIKTPAGQKAGKARQAFSLEEMLAVLDASVGYRNMDAYVHLSFLTGISPDEARGLHWAQIDDLDSDEPGIDITRTQRHHGGTKTADRRRGLGLPQAAVDSLKRHRKMQAADRLAAGEAWQDNDLVFTKLDGGPLTQYDTRKRWRAVVKKAGLADWDKRVPYEMRHTYASLMSDSGIPAEEIAQQLGHSRTQVLELVYRHVLKPRRRDGQRVMDTIVGQRVG